MRLEFPNAYAPLMTTPIELTVTDGVNKQTLRTMAYVVKPNPYGSNIGGAASAEVYSVSFLASSIGQLDCPITRGARVVIRDAYKTQLSVQHCYVNNGLFNLECTSRERGTL